jgi:ubiquinone biosynthesis protein
VAVALRDPDSVARILNRIGVPDVHSPIVEFKGDIRGILERYLGLKLEEIRTATLLRDLLDLSVRHRIRIPKEYAVLAKASITVEGIIRRLYPRLDILEIGLPYAKELLLQRFNPGDASSTLMKSLLKIQGLAEDVPGQLTQILVDLEGGKFRVNVHSEDVERVGAHVRTLGVLLFLGLVASGLTAGGVVALAIGASPWIGGLALGAAALASGAALAYHVATLRMKKISLRRWIGKS